MSGRFVFNRLQMRGMLDSRRFFIFFGFEFSDFILALDVDDFSPLGNFIALCQNGSHGFITA